MLNSKMTCFIAGIHFEFFNLEADKFSKNFLPFLCPESAGVVDAQCTVHVNGANPDLRNLKSDKVWSFEKQGCSAVLTGAEPEGDLLWRMTGEPPYELLSFDWNPDTFFKTYNDDYHGPFGIIIILALVLRLLGLKGIVLHCSSSVLNETGIICTGRSGQGKSTISALLKDEGVDVLTDERAIIRVEESGLRVYGSPWPSSGMCVLNSSAPLSKIYFLEHGPVNELRSLSPGEALKRLLDVVMVPWMNSEFFDPLIDVLESVVGGVPAAVLSFVPDRNVVNFIREDLEEKRNKK